MHLITVATCSLNQWALDLDGNRERIMQSIRQAKAAGATLRVGPELEITGYSCQDHFLELDLYEAAWSSLRGIIDHQDSQDILLDLGMPVLHRSCYFNCRVLVYNRRILLVKPKKSLADSGNFRESRWFTPWRSHREVEDHLLPEELWSVTSQKRVPFGDAIVEALDTTIAAESCEELFTPDAPHVLLGLNGVEIFTNSSGSHHSLRKLNVRFDLIREATRKSGGCYLYANQQGCDGEGRIYFDGCASVIVDGKVLSQGKQFSLSDVEVVTATVDLDQIRAGRFEPSRRMQAIEAPLYPRIQLDVRLGSKGEDIDPGLKPTAPRDIRYHEPEEEIALGPACWLWDYLRRSKQAGYFVPLSGGIDSCSTAVIVFSMAREVIKAVEEGNEQVIEDVRRISGEPAESTWLPKTPQEVCGRLFHTCFMGTTNSSKETRSRAKELAEAIGAYHVDMNMDVVVKAVTTLFTSIFNFSLRYQSEGGSSGEDIALQNIQSRLRMVLSYLFAQTLPLIRKRAGGGSLLVLGSANVDETLRGYYTKYDCSSADLNPIGAISKVDLKKFIAWAEKNFSLPILDSFLTATPTAELRPFSATIASQSDEVDMGCTYADLSTFGILRKNEMLGPVGMFTKLLHLWSADFSPREVYAKVRHFHYYYGVNRHKTVTLTPSYFANPYSPDDKRYDLRPFLYPQLGWAWRVIERAVERLEARGFGGVRGEKEGEGGKAEKED